MLFVVWSQLLAMVGLASLPQSSSSLGGSEQRSRRSRPSRSFKSRRSTLVALRRLLPTFCHHSTPRCLLHAPAQLHPVRQGCCSLKLRVNNSNISARCFFVLFRDFMPKFASNCSPFYPRVQPTPRQEEYGYENISNNLHLNINVVIQLVVTKFWLTYTV